MYGLYHPYLYFLVAIFQSLFSCRYYLKSSFFRFYHLNLYLLASIILISIFSVLSSKSIPSCFYHLNLYLVFFFFPCVLICLSGSLLSRATCAAVCLAVRSTRLRAQRGQYPRRECTCWQCVTDPRGTEVVGGRVRACEGGWMGGWASGWVGGLVGRKEPCSRPLLTSHLPTLPIPFQRHIDIFT